MVVVRLTFIPIKITQVLRLYYAQKLRWGNRKTFDLIVLLSCRTISLCRMCVNIILILLRFKLSCFCNFCKDHLKWEWFYRECINQLGWFLSKIAVFKALSMSCCDETTGGISALWFEWASTCKTKRAQWQTSLGTSIKVVKFLKI